MTKEDYYRIRDEVYKNAGIDKFDFDLMMLRIVTKAVEEERERVKWDSIHSCHPHCDRPACVAVRRAREDEREACANLVEQAGVDGYGTLVAAILIRERGAP